jgi:hypothetical protein
MKTKKITQKDKFDHVTDEAGIVAMFKIIGVDVTFLKCGNWLFAGKYAVESVYTQNGNKLVFFSGFNRLTIVFGTWRRNLVKSLEERTQEFVLILEKEYQKQNQISKIADLSSAIKNTIPSCFVAPTKNTIKINFLGLDFELSNIMHTKQILNYTIPETKIYNGHSYWLIEQIKSLSSTRVMLVDLLHYHKICKIL